MVLITISEPWKEYRKRCEGIDGGAVMLGGVGEGKESLVGFSIYWESRKKSEGVHPNDLDTHQCSLFAVGADRYICMVKMNSSQIRVSA